MTGRALAFSIGLVFSAIALADGLSALPALVPAPKSCVVREGICLIKPVEDLRAVAVVRHDEKIAKEGYRLVVTSEGVTISSADEAGAFYAFKTLDQLAERDGRGGLRLPCVEIDDAPAYPWRGVLLDEARHFFGKETAKRMIDLAAAHKFNVFHWHLMDDEGWRLESEAFPDLLRYGATRPESLCHGSSHDPSSARFNGQPYGPFYYTKADVREVLAYAAARHVRVMPEVEFPAHARAALAAYPQFSCMGRIEPRSPRTIWGGELEVFCAGNDGTIRFLERLIDEVCELFPFAYVHIGGDECPKTRWKACQKCQNRIRDLGLGDEEGLQKWMTAHFTAYLAKKGRRAVGWDEILSAGVPEGSVVMSWRGAKGGVAAAQAGSEVIMTPNTHCYLDYRQGLAGDPFQYIGGPNGRCITLERAYAFNPVEGVPAEWHGKVLGGQANCWSEYTWNEYDLQWKTWPRACAIAESLWTGSGKPGFADFLRRMKVHRARLVADYVNCARWEAED